MKLESQFSPLFTDDVFTAKRKLLAGVWWFDSYGMPIVHSRFRYIYFERERCRFNVMNYQTDGLLIGVPWDEPMNANAVVNAAATKNSFTVIALGYVRRRMLSEFAFFRYAYAKPEWFY
jgi:hypothetical protein